MDASTVSENELLRTIGSATMASGLAEENRRLKRVYTEVSMQNDLLNETLGKKR